MLETFASWLIVAMWKCESLIHRSDFLRHSLEKMLLAIISLTHPLWARNKQFVTSADYPFEYSEIIGIERKNSWKLMVR